MTPAAALVNEARLWVFCYSGLCNCPSDLRSSTPQWRSRAINDDRSKLALRDGELSQGGSGSHLTFGTPRWSEPGCSSKRCLRPFTGDRISRSHVKGCVV